MTLTEIRQLLATAITTQLPTQDTTTGSVTDDIVITPYSKVTADIVNQIEDLVDKSDLFSTSGDFDTQKEFFANLGINALEGKASGYVNVETEALSETGANNTIREGTIITSGGNSYTIVYGGVLDVSVYNPISQLYVLPLYVEAVSAGSQCNLPINSVFTSSSIDPSFTLVNRVALEGGELAETQSQFLTRVVSIFKSFTTNNNMVASYIKATFPTLNFTLANKYRSLYLLFKPTIFYQTTATFQVGSSFIYLPEAITIDRVAIYNGSTLIAVIDPMWYYLDPTTKTIDLTRFVSTHLGSNFVITYTREGNSLILNKAFSSKQLDPNLSSLAEIQLKAATGVESYITVLTQFPTLAEGNAQIETIKSYIQSIIDMNISAVNSLDTFNKQLSQYVTSLGGALVSIKQYQFADSSSTIQSQLSPEEGTYISVVNATVEVMA